MVQMYHHEHEAYIFRKRLDLGDKVRHLLFVVYRKIVESVKPV